MKYALVTLALTASILALPTKNQANPTADLLKLDSEATKLADGLENHIESLIAGVTKREKASSADLKNIASETVGPMLHEVESLLSSLTNGIVKREASSDDLLDVNSMLGEVKTLLGGLTGGILKREADSGGLLSIKSMLGEVKSMLGSLTGGIVKRQASSSDVAAVDFMLHGVEPLLSSLTGGIAKLQASDDITKDTELAASMLAEVKNLISSFTHGIAERQATTTSDALDNSPAEIDALIDSLRKPLSTLKGGVAKRQDTDITAVVERLEALLEPLKVAASTL